GAFKVVGGYTGTAFTPTPITGTNSIPDPLRYLPQPSAPSNNGTVTKGTASATTTVTTTATGTTTTVTTTATFSTGTMTTTMTSSSPTPTGTGTTTTTSTATGTAYLLTPGKYGKNGTSLPKAGNGDVVLFTQQDSSGNGGIYYIDGGGWSLTSSASL